MSKTAFYAVVCLALGTQACSKETASSSDIRTGGIAALIDVYANDATSATVRVELRVGGSSSNTYVDLDNGDKLVASAGDDSKDMRAVDTGIFEADFDDVEEGTEFKVVLDRPEDESATDNSGTLPPPFDLDEPESGLSREDDDLTVTWSPAESGDEMSFDFEGDCIFDESDDASDTGEYTVRAGTLESTGGDEPETCDITVEVERSREGSADSAFDPESWFRLHQRRKATFTSEP